MTDGVTYNDAPHRVFRRGSRSPARYQYVDLSKWKQPPPAPGPEGWTGVHAVVCMACGAEHRAGVYRCRTMIEDCPGCGLKGLR